MLFSKYKLLFLTLSTLIFSGSLLATASEATDTSSSSSEHIKIESTQIETNNHLENPVVTDTSSSPVSHNSKIESTQIETNHFDNMESRVSCKECFIFPCCSRINACRLEFGAAFGSYIGLRQGYSELGIFASSSTPSGPFFFVEGREFRLAHKDWAGSLGVGFRTPICFCSSIFGANIYYDYRESNLRQDVCCQTTCQDLSKSLHTHFSRIGLGFEMFSPCIDSRLNIYIPVKSTRSGKKVFFNLTRGFRAHYRNKEFTPYGIDGEVGRTIPLLNCLSAYAAIGAYAYHHNDFKSFWGPHARIEINWLDYLSLQFRYSYDCEFHSSYQGEVLFSIPLEKLFRCFCDCPDICYNRYDQRVRRNYIPFTEKRCCWKWNW